MKLSIVIPVYQVEQTLDRCLDSIMRQPPADCEIILVDDGATDTSPAICDEWATRDSRIKVVHQANRGLSSARNTGIRLAQGDFITFVDSDDFVGDNTFAILMAKLSAHPEFDILEYPVYWHYGAPEQKIMKFGIKEYKNSEEYWINGKGYTHAFAWNKIFSRHLFDEVRFPEGTFFEDAHTLPYLLQRANVIGTTEEGMYYYVANPDGITANADGKRLADLLDAHIIQMRRMGISNELSNYYCDVMNIQLDVYNKTKKRPILPEPDWNNGRRIRDLEINRKTRMKLRVLRHTNIKTLCRLNLLIHKMGRNH